MDRKGVLRIICLIIPLFFIGLALCSLHVSWAEESPPPISQIVLTDENGQEFSDGILLDNFEYLNNPDKRGWEIIDFWSPYSYIWNYSPSLYLNTVLDYKQEAGSRVLDVYMPSGVFLIEILRNETCAIKKKAAYADPNGVVFDSIPDDFNFLHFEVKAPLAIEQFQTFKFEVQVKTDNTGYAGIVIIAEDKTEGVSPFNALETVEEDVETISHDPQNPSIIEIYIGKTYADGKRHQVKMGLNAAIKKYSALDEELAQILSVIVRGNKYRLDNIMFTKTCNSIAGAVHLFHIGPVYFQLYGQQGYSPEGRWIMAEDGDLGMNAAYDDGDLVFADITDPNNRSFRINQDGTVDAGFTATGLSLPGGPADADLSWILTMGDSLGPQITDGFFEVATVDTAANIDDDDMNSWPPYLIQRDGVLIQNMVDPNYDPDVDDTPYLATLENPMYALACALGNSGYSVFPQARRIVPYFGQVFEDMIATCRVSDGMTTDIETFPISVVNYPVTNNPPIINAVHDQVFEVGLTNYYQIVAIDPDPEDMDGLIYHATLNGLPPNLYGPWWYDGPINHITGLITFTPFSEGTFDCIVTVQDPRGMMAVCQFTISCEILDTCATQLEVFPGLNSLCIPPGTEETHPNVSSLWNLFINQNHQVVKIQAFSPDTSKWLTFRQTSPGVTHGEDFSLTRGKTIFVYTDQTEVKNLELTFSPIQPAPPLQSIPELCLGLNQVNLHFSLFKESNYSEKSEEEWPQGQDIFQKFDQEEKESTSFMSLNPYQGKWQAKYPFFGLLAGSEPKVEKRGYLVFMK